MAAQQQQQQQAMSTSQHESSNNPSIAVPLAMPTVADRRAFATEQYIRSTTNKRRASPPVPITIPPLGRVLITKRTIPTKLQFIKRHLFTKATNKIKTIAHTTGLPSPRSPKALKMRINNNNNNGTKNPADNDSHDALTVSTAVSTSHDSITSSSSSTIASIGTYPHRLAAPSSITTSTCDFSPDPNLDVIFESYLASNHWDAAKKGDYATLSYMVCHDDANIWTQKDQFGHVPLYYACTSYSKRGDGLAFGKYGLESVQLLVSVWPRHLDLPRELLERCSMRDAIHEDVVEVLSRSGALCPNAVVLSPGKSKARIQGMADVVPVSFLEDLGDDGYVEDY
mmetsp:Transcript_17222/g.37377  ORF Transcript_17222/g.37377 Transcript_17222/m.37377 type:complete len:340 (-) Transcript_17222:70-1089(-)